jgi:hypothetical protein
MTAVRVCSVILSRYYIYFTKEEVEDIVESMCILLNELKKEDNELATIAEANALIPALRHPKLRNSISEYCSVKDLVTRAVKVRENLKELANNPDKLLKNKHFIDWATSVPWISQQNIKRLITNIETHLMFSLAEYKLDSGELDEASKLFDEAAEACKSIGDWYNYITDRDWFLRAEVLKARSINEYVSLASNFEKLWNETLENLDYTAMYLVNASRVLGNYLVYLASIGRYDDIEKILNEHAYLLNYNKEVSVLARLMLRLLGFTNVTEFKPKELIDVYEAHIYPYFLPALKLALDIEASDEECEALEYRDICRYAFLAVKGNNDTLTALKIPLNNLLRKKIQNDVEIFKLLQELDGKALAQLLAPMSSECQLALMLYTLVSGNAELAKKHALWGSKVLIGSFGRLFSDVYGACCGVTSEGFKLALLKLYYHHI